MAFAGLISDSISTVRTEKTFTGTIRNFILKNYKYNTMSSLNEILEWKHFNLQRIITLHDTFA